MSFIARNYSQTQLDQLDRLTERWVADHLQKGKTSKKDKEPVTLEVLAKACQKLAFRCRLPPQGRGQITQRPPCALKATIDW